MSGGRTTWVAQALRHVAAKSAGQPLDRSLRVTLSFHPDRSSGGRSILRALRADGVYRNQFETGTSNGGLTAHVGGDRWRWEQRMFGHAYDGAPNDQRPKYGALNHRRRLIGGAPRFGSAHVRLTEAVLDRTTFCFPDSVAEPVAAATAEHFDLFPLVEAFEARPLTHELESHEGGLLDDYVEAQVHGPIELGADVEALVLDPCYRCTDVEREAVALGVPIEWHEGRVLHVDELARHPRYRGERTIRVGTAIAQDQLLDARVVGVAVRQGEHDP